MKQKKVINKMGSSNYHVSISAESFSAALFARAGYDVSVQYGANQPEYDLMISKADNMLKVSVKGSTDGSWGLTQTVLSKMQKQAEKDLGTKPKADYHKAADEWLKKHSGKTIFCLVQFLNVELTEMPRVYIATPIEIVAVLKKSSKKRGDTMLFENHTYGERAFAAGTTDIIPQEWLFSERRVNQLFEQLSKQR